jgi:phosphoribosylaminoimidazole-succinocarboxamide synthase
MSKTVKETQFSDLKLFKRGKVRDVYELDDALLMVASDRISAFDVVMSEPIPDKGKILTRISLFWFDFMKPLCPNHVIASDVEKFPKGCTPYLDELKDRSMLVKKAAPLPIECVVRGYLSGSGWKSYQQTEAVCGIKLPPGLKESDKLPEPIFTPSTKAELGEHDENITFEEAANKIGKDMAEKVKHLSLAIYKKGAEFALHKGIIIADTKFEFGIVDNEIILIDELLTPDSSRFWPKSEYKPGGTQKSFDKQFLRDYLLSTKWNKTPPPPPLPETVIEKTKSKYLEALRLLSGDEL